MKLYQRTDWKFTLRLKLFSCSIQLSMKFQLPIRTKKLKNKSLLAIKLSYVVFIMLINVKMPTAVGIVVGILIFMSIINFMLS